MRAEARDQPVRGFSRLPPSADLSALWRDSEVGELRQLRQLRRQAGVAEQGNRWPPTRCAEATEESFPSTYRSHAAVATSARSQYAAAAEADPALADYLREWRRNMARENKVPAYIVLHDSTLEELCRRRPRISRH